MPRSTDSVETVKTRASRAKKVDPKTKEANAARRSKAKKESAELTGEKVLSVVEKAKLQASALLNQVGEELFSKVETLANLNEAIEAAKDELQQLHDNDVVLSETAALIAQHEEKKAELEEEIARLHTEWAKEQEDHETAIAERDADLQKSRKREADDYNYKLLIDRRKQEDAFNEDVRQRKITEQNRRREFDKLMLDHETALSAREAEFESAKKRIENIDNEINDVVKKMVGLRERELDKEHAVELERVISHAQADKQLLEQRIQHHQADKAALEAQVAALRNELKEANNNVTTLATSAMSSVSGQQALKAVDSMADKMTPKK